MGKNQTHYNPVRLTGLVDGIFAIAMTLLVIELRLPEKSHSGGKSLGELLNETLPELEIFAITFAVLGLLWMRHQIQLSFVSSFNFPLAVMNILFAMFAALTPFTASFVTNYISEEEAFIFYAVNFLLMILLLYLQWNYTINKNLSTSTNEDNKHINLMLILTAFFIAASIALSLFNVRAAVYLIFADVLIYTVFYKLVNRRHKSSESLTKERLEFLSDAVFGIVMTILILSLIETSHGEFSSFSSKLHEILLDTGKFIFTCIVLGIIWIKHHNIYERAKSTDKALNFLNLLFLMFLCLIPFTTDIFISYDRELPGIVAYAANIIIVSILLYLQSFYITKNDQKSR